MLPLVNGNRWHRRVLAPLLGCLLLFAALRCEAQGNLVPNAGFEDADTCAAVMNYSAYGKPLFWDTFSDTPDYYRSCVPYGSLNGVPQSVIAYQQPFEGASFSGCFTYDGAGQDFREMIGVQLADPLVVGQTYYASMRVNVGTDGSGPYAIGLGSDRMGMLFTMDPYHWTFGMPFFGLRNFAQVFSEQVITDTMNWTLVSGSFVADSAYRYLVIGNHFADSLTVLDTITTATPWREAAYTLIDAVCVSDDPEGCPMRVGVPEFHTGSITIYPNPAASTIQFWGVGGSRIQVLDQFGRQLLWKTIDATGWIILDVSSWCFGQYVLRSTWEGGNSAVRFVVSN